METFSRLMGLANESIAEVCTALVAGLGRQNDVSSECSCMPEPYFP